MPTNRTHTIRIEALEIAFQELAQREISLENSVQSLYNELHPLIEPQQNKVPKLNLLKALLYIPFTTVRKG